MAALTLDTTLDGETAVIALGGELDMAGAAALEQELAPIGAGTVVLDLSDLAFIDSSGLRAVVTASQRLQAAGRRFALVPGAAQVMRVFEITRMRERLEFVTGAGEAAEPR